jgi:hypothetical protein
MSIPPLSKGVFSLWIGRSEFYLRWGLTQRVCFLGGMGGRSSIDSEGMKVRFL